MNIKNCKDKIEIVKRFYLGKTNLIQISIYGKNIDSEEPSFSFEIKFFNGDYLSWKDCSENNGGFEYENQKDAINAALDFLVDHSCFHKIVQKDLRKKAAYDADLLNDFDENPEDNVEEIPEDFRLDMKNN